MPRRTTRRRRSQRTRRWILTALGQDRPGIVAAVTRMLYRLGANLEDSAMTRLAGEFAVMLSFTVPARVTRAMLETACDSLGRRLKLTAHLTPLSRGGRRASAGRGHYISVYGADRPGIVYRVSEALAALRVNITDVSTHRTTGRGKPLYLMVLEVELPRRVSPARVERRLRTLARRLGVGVSLRSADATVL